MKANNDGPFKPGGDSSSIKSKLDMKVCSVVTIDENGANKDFVTTPEQSGEVVPSSHEFITNVKEDIKDMNRSL